MLKETIVRYPDQKKTLFMTAIDAGKAFDRLARESPLVKLRRRSNRSGAHFPSTTSNLGPPS